MADESTSPSQTVEMTALAQSRRVAANLSVTARKLRFSTSNRSKQFEAVGLRPRTIERISRWVTIAATIILVVIPNTASVIYFTSFASDQFQSETRFVLKSPAEALGKDQLAKATGLPAAAIGQDLLIVSDYIFSKDMVDRLQNKINFREIYGNSSIDPLARLKGNISSERMLNYWKGMVSVNSSPSSGIVTVTVRAFSPEDAQRVLKEVVAASETTVNGINDRIWRDVTKTATDNVDTAKEQLQETGKKLQTSRNQTGVLSVEGSSTVLSTVIANVRKEKLDLQQKYNSQLGTVSPDAPQMLVLKRGITSRDEQIKQLMGQLAGNNNKSQQNLANASVDISQNQLEQNLAEQQLALSIQTLQRVKLLSRQQLLYLDAFLAPTLPDKAEYPRRELLISMIFSITVVAWGAAQGLLSLLRRQFQ